MADVRLKQNIFQRFGAHEAQKIEIRETLKLRGDIEVGAGIHQKNSGIHKVSLSFLFAGTHAGQKAALRSEVDAGARQTNGLAVPETEMAAGKIRQIHDGIEAARAPIARVGIPGRIKRGNPIANPVAIEGKFRRRHLGVYGDAAPGDGVKRILADRLIKRVRQIELFDVAAAKPAEITHANAMSNRANTLMDDITDRCGAHQETIVVVVDAGIVLIPRSDEFRGVAGKEKVLQVDVAEN